MQHPIELKPDQFHDKNVARVVEKMEKRAALGLAKYGHDTTRNDFTLVDWLLELQAELMDGVVYIEAALNKTKVGE